MEKDDILANLAQELRRGTIVLCVLNQLRRPQYGYNLVATLAGSGIAVETNTLYPLLRRLEGQGLLQSQWETEGAKPRKYYATTPLGNQVYAGLKRQWEETVEGMRILLEEDEK